MGTVRAVDLGEVIDQRAAAQRIIADAISLDACAAIVWSSRWRVVERFVCDVRAEPVRTIVSAVAAGAVSFFIAAFARLAERLCSGPDVPVACGTTLAAELRDALAEEWVLAIEFATMGGRAVLLDIGFWPLTCSGVTCSEDDPHPMFTDPEDAPMIAGLLAGTLRRLVVEAGECLILPNGCVIRRHELTYVAERSAAAAA